MGDKKKSVKLRPLICGKARERKYLGSALEKRSHEKKLSSK